MALETFDFPYHSMQETFPTSSAIVQFGRGYRFASKPKGPDQILFTLNFPAMFFFEQVTGSYPNYVRTILNNVETKRNMQCLIEFYERHGLYKKFNYPHVRRGTVVCRFSKPLEVPELVKDGLGSTNPFRVELILEP